MKFELTLHPSWLAIVPSGLLACSVTGADLAPGFDPSANDREVTSSPNDSSQPPIDSGNQLTNGTDDPIGEEPAVLQSDLPDLEGLNLLDNSDAETGLTGWTADFGGTLALSDEQARSGSHSVLLTRRTQQYHGVHRNVTTRVVPGAFYSVRAFALLRGSGLDNLLLTAQVRCQGLDDLFLNIASTPGSDLAWAPLDGEFHMPSPDDCQATHVSVYVEGPGVGVDLFVDDFQMVSNTPVPEPSSNLVENPDFESGLDGWTAEFGGTLLIATDPVHDGQQSLRTIDRTRDYDGPYYDLTEVVTPGATYAASAFALHTGTSDQPLRLTARIECDGRDPDFPRIADASAQRDQWTQLAGELRVPDAAECDLSRLLLYAEGPAPGVDLFLDDVLFEPSADAPALDNVLANGSFEDGLTGAFAAFGGTLSNPTSPVHSGAGSALVTDRSEDYQGVHFDLTTALEAGARYGVSAFARASADDDVSVTARLRCDGETDEFIVIDGVSATAGEWVHLRGELVVPALHQCYLQELLLYVEGPAAGVDLYVDDVWVVEREPAGAVVNEIENHDFEAGLQGWSAAFGGTLGISALQAHTGTRSAAVSGRTETFHGVHQDLTSVLTPGVPYDVSAFARLRGAPSDALSLKARVGCAGQPDLYLGLEDATGSDIAWTRLSGVLTLPTAAQCALTEVLLYVEGPAAGVDLLVDDVWVVAQ